MREQQRLSRIGTMQKSIQDAESPDLKLLIMKCCAEWGCSLRKAKEYLEVAQFNISNAKQ